MKPLWGIDITTDKQNETMNGEEWIVQTVSSDRSETLEKQQNTAEDLIESSKLPARVRLLGWVSGIVAALLGVSILSGIMEIGLAQTYENASFFFWGFAIFCPCWAIITFLSRKKSKEVLESDHAEQLISSIDSHIQDIYTELGVPSDAVDMDVLLFRYKMKDGVPVAKAMALSTCQYANLEVKVFVQENALCFADLENLCAIPLSNLRSIQTVHKKISVPEWNKEEDFSEGIYKQYKMTEDKMGCIFFKPYHVLEFEGHGDTWGLYFPCYELPIMEKLTGLSAQE